MEVTKRQFSKMFLVAAVDAFGRNTACAKTLPSTVKEPKTSSTEDLAFHAFRPLPAKSSVERQAYSRGIEAVTSVIRWNISLIITE